MTELNLSHRAGNCQILIQRGLAQQAGNLIRAAEMGGKSGLCAVITDSNVGQLHGEALLTALKEAGLHPVLIEVTSGENSKSLTVVGQVIDQLAAARLDRHGFVIAFGGGVIGDLAGFIASIYYRGIPYVQIPTTVISQCDSAIGGKTGVNTSSAKNLVGSFHPARLVLVDPDLLATLPEREFNEGFAEVIKHAIIADQALFDELAVYNQATLENIIRRNLEIKAHIVSADEFETTGERAKLNFGHTIGHGIEQAAGYGKLLHGEAISLGIVAASRISARKLGLAKDKVDAIQARLRAFNLPTQLSDDIKTRSILESLLLDKKFQEGNIRFVLVPKIGEALLSSPGQVTLEDLEEAILALRM